MRYELITDCLLDELAPSDTDAVLAHELGHARHHDVIVGPAALMAALARLTELNAIKRDTSLAWDEKVGHPGMARRIGRLEAAVPAASAPDPRPS